MRRQVSRQFVAENESPDEPRAQTAVELEELPPAGACEVYLRRPDLGRTLRAEDRERLAAEAAGSCDLAVVVADGLSAEAVQRHAAAVLAATSVAAVGVVGFLGLVAPHVARALVGGRHVRVIPVAVLLGAVLLGAVLLGLADAAGRWVITPAQIPAGLAVALLGAPYFVYLLARTRART